jgi:AcrR family transcriptional regulator
MARLPRKDEKARGSRYDGAEKRRQLLIAALELFSRIGYDAASTRAIAAAAGIEQGHLAYYFPSKMALWQQVIETFAREPERRLRERLPLCADLSAVEAAQSVLPDFLRTFAENPSLTRLMLQEFSVTSERQTWLVEHFAQPVWVLLSPLLVRLRAEGALGGADPEMAYFSMIGSALITFGNTGLIQQLSGASPGSTNWREAAIQHMIRPVLARP